MPDDQQAVLSRGDVRIVVLVEAVACAVVHDLRFEIGAIVLDGSHCAVLSVRPDEALRKRMALGLQGQERLWQRSALLRRASLKSSGMVNLPGGPSMKSLRG